MLLAPKMFACVLYCCVCACVSACACGCIECMCLRAYVSLFVYGCGYTVDITNGEIFCTFRREYFIQ